MFHLLLYAFNGCFGKNGCLNVSPCALDALTKMETKQKQEGQREGKKKIRMKIGMARKRRGGNKTTATGLVHKEKIGNATMN